MARRFIIPLLVVTLAIVLAIGGAASPWYKYEGSLGGVTANALEFLTYLEASASSYTYSCDYSSKDCIGDQMKAMYGIIIAVCIVTILLLFVMWLILLMYSLEWCGRFHWRRHLRIPLIVIAILAVLTSLLAWLIFFWHPSALKTDSSASCSGSSSGPACEFLGDGFGPHAGWALYICVSFFAFIACVLIIIFGSPEKSGYTVFG